MDDSCYRSITQPITKLTVTRLMAVESRIAVDALCGATR